MTWRFNEYLSDRENLLKCAEALRAPIEIDITAMSDEERRLLRHSWTPFGGWKVTEAREPFPEVVVDEWRPE